MYVPGSIYFFTVVTYQRQPLFARNEMVERFREAAPYTRQRRPFTFLAGVILPDHIHVLWQMPEGDADYSNRWKILKSAFSRQSRGRVYRTAPERSGNPGFGNMPYATKRMTTAISMTCMTIRSSMAWPPRPGIARTVRSGDTGVRGGIRPIGERPCRRRCGRWIANHPGQAAGRSQPVDAGPREYRWIRCRSE